MKPPHRHIARCYGLAALLVAGLTLMPGVAQAQFPYDWHAVTPPSWFTESIDSSCHVREQYDQALSGNSRVWRLNWETSPNSGYCTQPLPPSPELGPGLFLNCSAHVSHIQNDGFPDEYEADWRCDVGTGNGLPICRRDSRYKEMPLGDPDESFNFDTGLWHDPVTFEAVDGCPPSASGNDSACQHAKQKVKKAQHKLQQADSPDEKAKAKKRLKKAKKRKREACG